MKENVPLIGLAWNVVWSIATVLAAWLIARGRAAKSEIAALKAEIACKADAAKVERHESKLTEHDRRIQTVEHDVEHLPSLGLFHQLALDFSEMKGDLKTMAVTLKTNTEMTRRIDNYLREPET